MTEELFDIYEQRAEYCAIRDGIIGSRFIPLASGVSRETALQELERWRSERGEDDDACVRVVRHGDPTWRSVSLSRLDQPVEAEPKAPVADVYEPSADGEDIPF